MTTDMSFTAEECALLRSLIGQRAVSFEGSPLGRNSYYEKIKVATNELTIVLSNSFDLVDVGYERGKGREDVGTLRVSAGEGPLVLSDVVSGPENVVTPIESRITGIEVVNDSIEMLRNGVSTNSFKFTQAVIFHLDAGDFVVDRSIWFEVFLDAFVTADGRRSLRDTEADWCGGADEDGYGGTVTREFVAL